MADVLNVLANLMGNWIETELKMKTKDRVDRIEGLFWLRAGTGPSRKARAMDDQPVWGGSSTYGMTSLLYIVHYIEQPLGNQLFYTTDPIYYNPNI